MKSFTTKLSTLALCAFVISSSVFAGSDTKIHIIAPANTNVRDNYFEGFADYNENNSHFDYNANTKRNDSLYISKNKNGGKDLKKKRSLGDFRGYAAWNWNFDDNYNETREALDTDGTVLCREVNGKVQPGYRSNHDSDTTCRRKH